MIIINADDFGLSDSVNRAVADAFHKNLISDTTLLANGSAFDNAVIIAKQRDFSENVGIHFNLTAGEPLTNGIKECRSFCENGIFHHRNNRIKPLSEKEKSAVYTELKAQAEKLKNAGFEIDHADSHHHIHTAVFIAPIVFRVCSEFGIDKIRIHRNTGKIPQHKRIVKRLYNSALRKKFKTTDYFGRSADVDKAVLGTLEIMVHPDYDKDGILIDRSGFKDGIPMGLPLYGAGVNLICYGDL